MHVKTLNMDIYLMKLALRILRAFWNKSKMTIKEYVVVYRWKKNVVFFDILMRPKKWNLRVVFSTTLAHFQSFLLLYWNTKLVLLNNNYPSLPVSYVSLSSVSSVPANIPFVFILCFFTFSPKIRSPHTNNKGAKLLLILSLNCNRVLWLGLFRKSVFA